MFSSVKDSLRKLSAGAGDAAATEPPVRTLQNASTKSSASSVVAVSSVVSGILTGTGTPLTMPKSIRPPPPSTLANAVGMAVTASCRATPLSVWDEATASLLSVEQAALESEPFLISALRLHQKYQVSANRYLLSPLTGTPLVNPPSPPPLAPSVSTGGAAAGEKKELEPLGNEGVGGGTLIPFVERNTSHLNACCHSLSIAAATLSPFAAAGGSSKSCVAASRR